jgi:adhesin transport system outer membrane protein
VAQQQANVLVSIDTIAHDTAVAMVQVQTWQQMVDTAKEQLDALSSIGTLTRQRNDEGARRSLTWYRPMPVSKARAPS